MVMPLPVRPLRKFKRISLFVRKRRVLVRPSSLQAKLDSKYAHSFNLILMFSMFLDPNSTQYIVHIVHSQVLTWAPPVVRCVVEIPTRARKTFHQLPIEYCNNRCNPRYHDTSYRHHHSRSSCSRKRMCTCRRCCLSVCSSKRLTRKQEQRPPLLAAP